MNEIVFQCGKSVKEIEKIFVKNIYAGFIEGVDDQRVNQELVLQFVKDVQSAAPHYQPYLFLNDTNSATHCVALPPYACAVSLRSDEPANNPHYLMSTATLVWFQERNPLTEGFDLIQLAKSLNWKDVAKDVNW